jgi:hypothetical protein
MIVAATHRRILESANMPTPLTKGPVPAPAPRDQALSLRACLIIATVFWLYFAITATVRWELMREAAGRSSDLLGADVITLMCAMMFPFLWLATAASWLAGYDLSRWPRLVAINVVIALLFGLMARPSLMLSTSLLRDIPIAEAVARLDGKNVANAVKLWTAGTIEDAAQYLILQALLAAAAFYVRLRTEQSLRERLASEYDRARLQALRMQTNPHFLFNALSAIAGLIRTRPESAESMVTGLGELFRATLVDRDADFVALRRELDLGVQYLEIQRARFDSRFTYRIHAPDEVLPVLVPPLLLQPLLENAAEHGLSGREGSIEVAITCELMEDRVRIKVTNQAGAPEPTVAVPVHGFGLENVRERIHAAFGDAATLTTNHSSAGTFEARLEFPARLASGAHPVSSP